MNDEMIDDNAKLAKDKAADSRISLGGIIQSVITKIKSRGFHTGSGCIIKRTADIRLTDGAILEMGKNVMVLDYASIHLTKPHPELYIGDNVVIGRGDMIEVKSKMQIGSNTIIGPYVQIIDHNHGIKREKYILYQLSELKEVLIGEDCWIGAGASILAGVTIGNGCVIGANAVVTKDLPDYSIAVGVPAKVVKYRE